MDATIAAGVSGASLDFGASLKPPRFRWVRLKVPDRCPCRRSYGQPTNGIQTPQCLSYVPQEFD